MSTNLFDRLHDLGEYLDSERHASGNLHSPARVGARPGRRRAIVTVAALAVAAVLVAVALASQSAASHTGVVWAAKPESATPTTRAEADAACRAASPITLPSISSIDLRGDVGVVLYEMKPAWQICTFARHGDDLGTAQLTPTSMPTPIPPVQQEYAALMHAGPVNVTVNDTQVLVMAGKFTSICSSNCFDVVHLRTDAGEGQAPLSPTGTFVIWVPAGTTSKATFGISR